MLLQPMVFDVFLETIRLGVFFGPEFFLASAEMTVFIRFSAVFFRLKGAGVFFGHLLYTAYKSLVLGMLYAHPKT